MVFHTWVNNIRSGSRKTQIKVWWFSFSLVFECIILYYFIKHCILNLYINIGTTMNRYTTFTSFSTDMSQVLQSGRNDIIFLHWFKNKFYLFTLFTYFIWG